MKRLVQRLVRGRRRRTSRKSPTWTKELYPEFQIGEGTYGKPDILGWGEGTTLSIGKYCSIAKGVKIFLGGEHRSDWVTTYPFSALWDEASQNHGHPKSKGNVVIGNDVWIATEAMILSGVTIGDGAVIGARALVTKNVLPYEIVGGNPARTIGRRFDDEAVSNLIKLKWWDLPKEEILPLIPYLLNTNVTELLERIEKR